MRRKISKGVEVDPAIMLGKPVIEGTRIPVEMILEKLAQNISVNDILNDYPRLTRKNIQDALEYAAKSIHGEEIHLVSKK
jgi:uncharacterized protein (DUF433 family)